MSKSRLVTPSLLGAIDWCHHAPPVHIDRDPNKPTWREKAYTDMHNLLNRIWVNDGPNPAIDRGIAFENAVYKEAANITGRGSEHFKWFVDECKGGMFQRKTKKYIDIDGFTYCIYGKLDAWWPDIIKDIKGTGKWKGNENYLDTYQHKLYCYSEGIDKFRYLVAVFAEDNVTITERHAVDYVVEDRAALEADIINKIKEAVQFLSIDSEWFDAYTTKYSMY